MRFMIIRRADAKTEAGVMPSEALLSAMGAYNQSMVDAGIFRAGAGLHPTAKGARIAFANGIPTITDGPFAETKEVIAGFTMIEVGSREEALDWVRRWPEPDVELELRQLFELSDFPVDPAETPDGWRAKEQAFHDRVG
ncbi:MAG TPA: YciI family protein [Acetobacteraceae bacterium]|nr:YciI family protein [Acetobacteraceae bacterium]